jgi:hypothetical protein
MPFLKEDAQLPPLPREKHSYFNTSQECFTFMMEETNRKEKKRNGEKNTKHLHES